MQQTFDKVGECWDIYLYHIFVQQICISIYFLSKSNFILAILDKLCTKPLTRWGVVGNRREALLWDLQEGKIDQQVKPVPVKVRFKQIKAVA